MVRRPSAFEGIPLPRLNGGIPLSSPLTAYNGLLFIFHLILGASTLGVGALNLNRPLYRPVAIVENNSSWITAHVLTQCGSINLTVSTALFFFISAFFHFGNAFFWRKCYLRGIRFCWCPSRWIEYTFSAGLMSILIAYSAGVVMLDSVIAIFALTSVTMFFGYCT